MTSAPDICLPRTNNHYLPIILLAALTGGEGETKCAAGCLIGDDEYKEKMEGKSWQILVGSGLVPPHQTESLILKLQRIHDNWEPCTWKELLAECAKDRGLSTAVLDEFAQEEPTK